MRSVFIYLKEKNELLTFDRREKYVAEKERMKNRANLWETKLFMRPTFQLQAKDSEPKKSTKLGKIYNNGKILGKKSKK
jgi:hypothetical protein